MINMKMISMIFLALYSLSVVSSHSKDLDCTPLDPRAQVSSNIETAVKGSAKTLLKVGEAKGEFENKLSKEIRSLNDKFPASDQTVINLRLMYLFCTMMNSSTEIPMSKKLEMFESLQSKLITVQSSIVPAKANSSNKKPKKIKPKQKDKSIDNGKDSVTSEKTSKSKKTNPNDSTSKNTLAPLDWPLVEKVSFSELPYKWPIGSWSSLENVPKAETTIIGGKYRWVVEFSQRWQLYNPLPYSAAVDFYSAIDACVIEPTTDPSISFLFGGDVRNKSYDFKVSSKGFYALIRHDGTDSKFLLGWAPFNVDMTQCNRLAVWVNGQVITLYLNNKQIGQYRDTSYTGGQLGLQVGGGPGRMVIDFDNFEYRAYLESNVK